MAMKGVLRPGIIQIRVLDMEAALRHYVGIIGMHEVSRDESGRVYLKCWDEFDRHSVVLRETEQAGMDFVSFKVDSVETLADFKVKLQAYGLRTEDIPAGEQPGVGPRVRFRVPTGHTIELYAQMDLSETGPLIENPDIWREPPRGIGPVRFDHCLLYGIDIDANERIFTDVLGFTTSEVAYADDGETRIALFFSCSTKAHDIAFIRHDEDDKFHHASFLLEDWNAIGHAADILTRYNVSADIGPTRHGITRGQTIYFWDPSGNRNEVFAGGYYFYPDNPQRHWTADQVGKSVFYYEKTLNETFLPVVT